MATEEELAKLRSDGLSPTDRIWVSHGFFHLGAEPDERALFREALKRAGFGLNGKVDSTEEITGDGYWHHYAFSETAADPATCERLDWLAEVTASEHGVSYDGWHVARNFADGKPSDMSYYRARRSPE